MTMANAVGAAPDRRGFVLILVLLMMILGSALMVGAINGSLSETETASVGVTQRQLLVGAESEAWNALARADVAALRRLPLGLVGATSRIDGNVMLNATVEKVDTSIVWIVATATIHGGGSVARHRIGITALIPCDTADLSLHPVPERAWVELF
jgi:hypothetical protein